MFLKLYWVHIKYSERLKTAFFIFANFWETKFESFFQKARRSFQDHCSKQGFLENGLEDNFRSDWISWALQNCIFHFFVNLLVTKLKPFFGESEANKSKLFKFKVVHSKYFRKRFWSYLEVKTECCKPLKMSFFSFLQIFERQSWNRFFEKWDKTFKNV